MIGSRKRDNYVWVTVYDHMLAFPEMVGWVGLAVECPLEEESSLHGSPFPPLCYLDLTPSRTGYW